MKIGQFRLGLRSAIALIALLNGVLMTGSTAAQTPTLNNMDRDRGRAMLAVIKDDIKKNYYDPAYHGIDLEARFKTADEKIKTATSIGQVFGIIAQVLIDFEDSHLFFLPPSRTTRTDYGWQMQMFGAKCYVVAVKPGCDAETKGLKPGDEIISVDGFGPIRENLWKLRYLYYTLRPRPGMHVSAVSPEGNQKELDVLAKVRQTKLRVDLTGMDGGNDIQDLMREEENEDRLRSHRYYDWAEGDLFVWKMPAFDLEDRGVDELMDKARKRKALILDLRGNPGGAERTLLRLIGHFTDHDLKLGDMKRRKETKPMLAKTRGDRIFNGKLVVLIDSNSASSAEIFARAIQLEKRGTVIGDQSAGAVMRAIHSSHQLGADTVVFYGVSVTDADLVMTDGKSLERTGVIPDELLLPTADDLAAKRDPVLARAAELAGFKITPERAGALFPIEWRK
ncbi:MAG TPA: S41 family peptidase [Blastocatellia bacterium]|nr:S41 family peptidase [Blastocatellia bacterium]